MRFSKWFEENGLVSQFWNSLWIGVPLWLLSAGLLVRWYFHIPPPGYAIGALAVVAGVMSVRDVKVLGKISWFILLVFLLVAEFRAIDSDRVQRAKEFLDQRKEQDTKFQKILDAQNKDFQAIAESLKDAYAQSQLGFGSTLGGISREINTYTGGDSYLFLTYIPGQSFLAFVHKGEYPVFSVTARIVNLDSTNHELLGTQLQLGDLTKGHALARPIMDSIKATESARNAVNLNVFFTARNGDWVEELRVRRDHDGNWRRAIIVEGAFSSMKKSSVMCETIDKNFPMESLDKTFSAWNKPKASAPPPCD